MNSLTAKQRDAAPFFDGLIREWVDAKWPIEQCLQESELQNNRLPKKRKLSRGDLHELITKIFASYTIPFGIIVSKEEWEKFASYYTVYPDAFMDSLRKLLDELVYAKVAENEERRKPPGSNRKKSDFVRWIRDDATRLYAIVSLMCENFQRELHKIIMKLLLDDISSVERDGTFDPERLTAFLISRGYHQELKRHNMERFFDTTSATFTLKEFRRTYVNQEQAEQIRGSLRDDVNKLIQKGNAKYLTKKDEKYPYVYTDLLAKRDDMIPCDKFGKPIDLKPCYRKGYKLVLTALLDTSTIKALEDPTE